MVFYKKHNLKILILIGISCIGASVLAFIAFTLLHPASPILQAWITGIVTVVTGIVATYFFHKSTYADISRNLQFDNIAAENIRDRLIQQLTVANEQLEQFAYVASHDLREPLRIIVSFTDLLAMEYSDRLDEEGREYMAINRRAAKKMEAMVADLLEYGRLGKNADRVTETNSNEIVRQTLEALDELIQSTHAVIHCDDLPIVSVNPLRFLRLFQNLVGNALKYHSLERQPVITIHAQDKNNHWGFSIADNGIGIEEQFLETIFAPFKRLHSDQEYSGTGIGLAICKGIVEEFGGTLWATSVYGSGSVFYFTVPKTKIG